jgi:hypothetical protein
MKNSYTIDFFKLMVELLPVNRRKPKFIAVVRMMASQFQNIHFNFLEFINDFEQGTKTQKRILQAEINKWFDPYQERIFLRNVNPNYDALLFWQEAENKPQLISNDTPFLLQPEDSLLQGVISFEVVLPLGLV